MKRLVLVRHGQSAWNKSNQFTGWTNVDLTEQGIEEAHEAGRQLHKAGFRFGKAYTSYLKRAIKTLNIIQMCIRDRLMLLVAPSKRAFRTVWRDARKHASPNSGYPESALAGILGVQFGGPNIYHGLLVEKPYIGAPIHPVTARSLRHTILIVIAVTLLASALVLLRYLLV